jgi:hypothetical protein
MTGKGLPFAATDCGIALVAVLLVSSLVFVLVTGLLLALSIAHMVVRNHRESMVLARAAETGLVLAARHAEDASWDALLGGLVQAPGVDGAPGGVRTIEGGAAIALDDETSRLTCGLPGGCSDADRQVVTTARPWGANNPDWRLFLYGPLATLGSWRYPPPVYLLVWVGDDGREVDGNPRVDGGAGTSGAGVLRVHAMAIGRDGARQAVEAELVRACEPVWPGCPVGIRVQGRHDFQRSLP